MKTCASAIVIGGPSRWKFNPPHARIMKNGRPVSSIPFCPAAQDAVEIPRALRHGVELFVAEMAGHDGDWNGELTRVLGDTGDQRARPLFAGCGGEYQDRDVFVVFDEIEDF